MTAAPFAWLRAWGQTAQFPGKYAATLQAIGRTVLPASLGNAEIDRVTGQFVEWVRGYRPNAEMEHGYGITRLRNKPPSPAPAYLAQLASMEGEPAAAAVQSSLARVQSLPFAPEGQNLVADLMAFYFRGSDAADRCYDAAIRREDCRGFKDIGKPPAKLGAAS